MQVLVGGSDDDGASVTSGVGLSTVDQSQGRRFQLLPVFVGGDQPYWIFASGKNDVALRSFPQNVGIAGNDGLADGVRQWAEIEKINLFECLM